MVHGWQFHCHATCLQYRTASSCTQAHHPHYPRHPFIDSRYYTEFGQIILCLSQHWLERCTRMVPGSGGIPGLYVALSFVHAGGRYLFKFYICHPSDWRYNAINQCYWLQYHGLDKVATPSPSTDAHLIRPSNTSDSYLNCHKLVPFRKWLNISHLDTFIHGPFDFAWNHACLRAKKYLFFPS
jgi:hypothetical protein